MVKNGKLLSVITLILLLCFTFTSFIACSKTDNSANKPTVEQTEQTSDDESTDSEEQSPDSEEQTSDSSTESSEDPTGESESEQQSEQTVNPPSNPVEESTYSAH